ncbi:MAG TPA: hypothetical protein VFV99_05465 [Kofleriaceae bacterium]|nr:hypothetical protein [Kofleriaceae bacterium]
MDRLACIVLCAVVSSGGAAYADDDYDAPAGPYRLLAGLEMGLTVSPADGPRRDTLPIGGLAFRVRIPFSERTALSLGTSIPFPPFITGQVIALYEWGPIRSTSGLVLRGGIRPLVGLVGLCDASGEAQCPLDRAAEPGDRAGWAIGVMSELGAGWRFRLGSKVSLEAIASYLGGLFDGRQRKTESALDGYYQGGMLSIDLLF